MVSKSAADARITVGISSLSLTITFLIFKVSIREVNLDFNNYEQKSYNLFYYCQQGEKGCRKQQMLLTQSGAFKLQKVVLFSSDKPIRGN